jgi:uncharacterized protein YndB with AHSA1/START domain
MASVKKKKATPSKKIAKKPVAKKAPAKKVAKKTPVKKATAPVKKSKNAKPVKAAPKKTQKKSPVKASLKVKPKVATKADKATKAVPVNKSSTGIKPSAKKPAIANPKPISKKTVPAKTVAKTVLGKAKTVVSKPLQVKPPVKAAVKNAKPEKAVVKGKKEVKNEAVEPLQAKAEKAIREMEETMDLSKMRPRIQAGTAPLKTLSKSNAPLPKLPEPTNTTKVKFQLEFEFRSSPKILFTSLSDSSGLAGWFADEVHTKDDIYTFSWEGGSSQAKLVALRELQLVRFQWLDDTDGTYFQFEIKEDDITSDIALIITDFANPGERDTNIRLWESQVQNLRMLLGSL